MIDRLVLLVFHLCLWYKATDCDEFNILEPDCCFHHGEMIIAVELIEVNGRIFLGFMKYLS